MAAKLLNLIALSSLAILACSFGATPANAVSLDVSPIHARSFGHHQLIAKKKRADSRRCKPRPTTSSVAVSSTTSASTKAQTSSKVWTSTKASTSSKAPAPTPTPPPPPPPPPAPASGGGGGGKAGLAWPNPASVPIKNFVTKKTGAVYNWSAWKPAGCDAAGLQYAPMLWGTKNAAEFDNNVKAGYGKVALGMNEPDHAGQANMSPWDAVTLWKNHMLRLPALGYRLGSPAVTSGSGGKTWLKNFLDACAGTCHVDIITVHWYGNDPNAFIAYVKDFHNTFGLPIWVTEFACQNFSGGAQCNAGQISNFMAVTTKWMDETPWVEQYFYFGAMHDMGNVNPLNQLLGWDNQPTALGWQYIG